jgi:hypothetical protein
MKGGKEWNLEESRRKHLQLALHRKFSKNANAERKRRQKESQIPGGTRLLSV